MGRTAENPVGAGVDIGGTFTDLMLIGERGEVVIGKVLTTSDPLLARQVVEGVHRGGVLEHRPPEGSLDAGS